MTVAGCALAEPRNAAMKSRVNQPICLMGCSALRSECLPDAALVDIIVSTASCLREFPVPG
jgi:hypothetical protein